MEVNFTSHPDDGPGDHFMVIGTDREWGELLRDLNGIGHSTATLELIAGLRGWGIR